MFLTGTHALSQLGQVVIRRDVSEEMFDAALVTEISRLETEERVIYPAMSPPLVDLRNIFFCDGPGQLSRYSDGLRAGKTSVRFPAEVRDFSLLRSLHTGSGAHPASHPMGTAEAKRPGREDDHSPQSSAEIKYGGAIPPLPHTSTCHTT
jgi:hypothetical protein